MELLGFIVLIIVMFLYAKFRIWWKSLPYKKAMRDYEKQSSYSNYDVGEDDPMYNEIVEFAVNAGKISASLIQRKYRFGYNRAARIIDIMESRGIIGPANGSKPREVLVKLEEFEKE